MRYVSSRINVKTNDDIYRIYVTSALKILTSNTAKFVGGLELTKTYSEIINPKDKEEEEEHSNVEEQAQTVIERMKSKIAKVR